jgi:hypothetical protein
VVAPIKNYTVARFYPKKNEHNRDRALLLIKGGNIDICGTKFKRCRSRADPSKLVSLFCCHCIPSQKTEAVSANEEGDLKKKRENYTVYLAFCASTGHVLGYPYSCCGCYDGRGFCSHLLATLCVFRLVQNCVSKDVFEAAMPVPPTYSQNVPTLLEAACIPEIEARRRGQKKRRLADKT